MKDTSPRSVQEVYVEHVFGTATINFRSICTIKVMSDTSSCIQIKGSEKKKNYY